MCQHVSALRAFELQLVQKPVVITTAEDVPVPSGLNSKAGPSALEQVPKPLLNSILREQK